MSAETELRKAILNFVKNHQESGGKAPSIRAICREVNGVSIRKFYKLFPEGLGEVCKKAGVPVPKQRIRATRKAVRGQEKKAMAIEDRSEPGSRIILADSQSARIQGISHLEGGKDPGMIIDELLDRDTYLREEKGLSLDDVKAVFDYIDRAKERKWKVGWLIGIQTKLWNAGLKSMSSEDVEGLAVFLENMKAWGWEAGDITRILNNPFIKDALPRLSYDDGVKMVEFIREAMTEGLTVSQYLNEMAKVSQNMKLYQEYFNKQITYDQLERTVPPSPKSISLLLE
ncbi:unnamed protein product, partial [marine sediment metagenome]